MKAILIAAALAISVPTASAVAYQGDHRHHKPSRGYELKGDHGRRGDDHVRIHRREHFDRGDVVREYRFKRRWWHHRHRNWDDDYVEYHPRRHRRWWHRYWD